MSFGFSISDAVLLTQLAWKVIQSSRKACGEYDDLTREAASLHIVLQRLQQEVGKIDGLISNAGYMKELESIIGGCEKVLKKLDAILDKYNSLGEEERTARKLWRKVRFGDGQVGDVAQLRGKLTYYVSALTLFLNMVSTGTVGRVERKMDDAGGELREIRLAVNGITAHLLAENKAEGSVFTAYPDDDVSVWRELRRELNREGFSSNFIHQNKEIIKAYIKELGSRGVLDDSDTKTLQSYHIAAPLGGPQWETELRESGTEKGTIPDSNFDMDRNPRSTSSLYKRRSIGRDNGNNNDQSSEPSLALSAFAQHEESEADQMDTVNQLEREIVEPYQKHESTPSQSNGEPNQYSRDSDGRDFSSEAEAYTTTPKSDYKIANGNDIQLDDVASERKEGLFL